jgi:broad specificity phosphatase PhoE
MTGRHRHAFDQAWLVLRIVLVICSIPTAANADNLDKPLQIWFVRHAESELNDASYPHTVADSGISYQLTQRGIQQANLLADELAGHAILEVYTSTLLRAIQTADAIAFRRGIAAKFAPEAVEIDLDSVAPSSDTKAIYTGLVHRWFDDKDPDARNGSGESFTDLQRRFLPFVREIMNRHGDEDGVVVIVSHSATLELMIPILTPNVPAKFALAHGLPNGAIVKTELRDGHLYCIEWTTLGAASFNDP